MSSCRGGVWGLFAAVHVWWERPQRSCWRWVARREGGSQGHITRHRALEMQKRQEFGSIHHQHPTRKQTNHLGMQPCKCKQQKDVHNSNFVIHQRVRTSLLAKFFFGNAVVATAGMQKTYRMLHRHQAPTAFNATKSTPRSHQMAQPPLHVPSYLEHPLHP